MYQFMFIYFVDSLRFRLQYYGGWGLGVGYACCVKRWIRLFSYTWATMLVVDDMTLFTTGSPQQSWKCIPVTVDPLRPIQNGRLFADDIFNSVFLNENTWTPIKISLTFVPKGLINNIPALVQIMAWRRPGDKQLFEPMMVILLAHICVTRPQWVDGSSQCIVVCLQISIWDYSRTTMVVKN